MSKIIWIIVLVIIIGGGWTLLRNDSDTMTEENSEMMEEDVMMEGDTASTHGSYTTYAADKVAAAGDDTVLLYFHADWCPICRPLDAALRTSESSIPSDVRIFKVDYDTETALKQKYGVTYQHTVVQVSSDGTFVKKWAQTTPTLASLLGNVQ